jgi:ribosomal protein S27E
METSEFRFPCGQCGASLRYEPGDVHLTCGYCGHEQDIPDSSDADRRSALTSLDLHAALAHRLPQSEIEVSRQISCPGCGAQVEFNPEEHSAECPFCATPVVTDTGTHRHIKPQALIPFQVSEREAHEKMNSWLKGLWFAPNGLSKFARNDRKLNGLYVPYWAFDAHTASSYRGEQGTYYYETQTRVVNGKTESEQVRKTRWRPVSGRVNQQFRDLLIMASHSLPRQYVRALEPWTLSEIRPYTPDFLSGFRAEGYTVELPEGHTLAIERMDEAIRNAVQRDIGGDEQRVHSVDTQRSDERFKHLLLPIWMAAYRYRSKSFRFVVNAQTGKVQGERPWSVWKITFAVLGAIALLGAIYYIGNMN